MNYYYLTRIQQSLATYGENTLIKYYSVFYTRWSSKNFFLGTKNWTGLITGCTRTDWFKLVNSIEKTLWEPYQWIELILLIHHQEIYINNFAPFYGFQSLFSIELTNLNQSVLVQPVIKPVQFFVPRKMERWIFTSNKNFKIILNQLGYFKGQLFGSLIMKYGFSRSIISFIENH